MKKKQDTWDPFPWRQCFPRPIVGVDEVGRGCLAGRVYAAAVLIPVDYQDDLPFTDSKLLSAKRREELARLVREQFAFGIGFATVEEIDSLNILQASLLAMKRAVGELGVGAGHLLVDGNQKIPGLTGYAQTTLVKGDLRATPIAAASILAKVTRDAYMGALAERFPEYNFVKHKGYSTQAHKSLIAQYGPCREHRRTFAGVREHC